MTEAEQIKEHLSMIAALEHAIQCAVGWHKERTGNEGEKHLRTGINLSMCRHGALVHLLVTKGLITELEYWRELKEAYKDEIKRYKEMYPGISFEGF